MWSLAVGLYIQYKLHWEINEKVLTTYRDISKTTWKETGIHQKQENTLTCHGQFNWSNPKTLANCLYLYDKEARGALEINKLKTPNERYKIFKPLNK